MLGRAIGAVAGLLVAALALPFVAAKAQEAVPVLVLLLVVLFAAKVWWSGLHS